MVKSNIRVVGPITFGEAYQIYHGFIRTGWIRANEYLLYAKNRGEGYTLRVDYNPEEELSISCTSPQSVDGILGQFEKKVEEIEAEVQDQSSSGVLVRQAALVSPEEIKLNDIAHKNIHSLSTYKQPKWDLPFMTTYAIFLERRGAGYDGFIGAKSKEAIDKIVDGINWIINPTLERLAQTPPHRVTQLSRNSLR